MKKHRRVLLFLSIFGIATGLNAQIKRLEPAFWWTDMAQPELQIMVYGEGISDYSVRLDYQNVRLKEVVRVENPNYLFLYLEINKAALPGTMDMIFEREDSKFIREFQLKERSHSVKAQGFDASDVLYLIMPDRFANGDLSNDVWDDVPIDRSDPFGRHGGDFEGIVQHLDYLKELGITTIWLNPVLENKMPHGSYHGYAITDYYKVDPRFGSNEDYRNLVETLHQEGMKIVMDMILNHCGSHHWWMEDLPAKDWLNHQDGFSPTSHDLYAIMDPYAPASEKERLTKGWFVPSMPDLNQKNPHLAVYLIQNTIWWIEYAGIDGIRHDTHPYVDFDFLSRWSQAVMTEYPNFNIVGESWYLQPASLAWWQSGSMLHKKETYLKTVMDFSLMDAINRAFIFGSEKHHNPLRTLYETLAQDFLYPAPNHLLIFLDNHDTSRFFKKGENNLNRYQQALAFLLTTRGIPQLYYGTEMLMHGEKSDGDGNLRKDVPGGWSDDSENHFTSDGRSELQNEAFDFIKHLLNWRKESRAVTKGSLVHFAPDYQQESYVYIRSYQNEKVMVALNGSGDTQRLPLARFREAVEIPSGAKSILSGDWVELNDDIRLPPYGIQILEWVEN